MFFAVTNFVSPCSRAEPGNRIHLCPLFNRLSWSDYRHHIGAVQDAYRLQLKLFLSEVRQQQLLSGIRSFLKLYTTISISKLASFMDVNEPTLRVALLMYKHKTHVINDDGSVLSNADVDFYVADVSNSSFH
jgi:translation initiation factor 3 subunit L